MELLLFFPFLLQTVVIGIDEGYFHLKRGLPKWERIGHPLDTLSVIACFIFVLSVPYSSAALKWFIGLSLFSCLLVTKDEFIHKHHCPASEQWLHALLFINHPIMLAALGWLWTNIQGEVLQQTPYSHLVAPFLVLQLCFITCFFLYQVIYWNFIWKEKTR
jgi:hypothetical protein